MSPLLAFILGALSGAVVALVAAASFIGWLYRTNQIIDRDIYGDEE